MGQTEYEKALKLGKKEYKTALAEGRFPFLPVLDEILSREKIQTEQNLGLVQIPLEFVVGTVTRGRTFSFAANFMPIMGRKSEFAAKWANLSDAQMNEGIRDPIKVYEYRNRYFVLEGNKRVSVLKYFNATSIDAVVTRKVPKYSEDEDIRIYYEYMKFYAITSVNNVEFSKLGNADKLLELIGHTEPWNDQIRRTFSSLVLRFSKAFAFRGGQKLSITLGDALTAFIGVYGYDKVLEMSEEDMSNNIAKCWYEFVMLTDEQSVRLVLDPVRPQEKKSLLDFFIPKSNKRLKVAFIYAKSPETSDWIYAHDIGRDYLERTFCDLLETTCVSNVSVDNIEETLVDVIHQGAQIIFEVGPQLMSPSLKIAMEFPDVKILNCILNRPHKYIRTYFARMYEAKFLAGVIAGALADNNRIAYIEDYPLYGLVADAQKEDNWITHFEAYPLYGMVANINAFALGASYTNPRAQIYLDFSSKKGFDRDRFLEENQIHIVSGQDMVLSKCDGGSFGLYQWENGISTGLAMPLWNWGVFYERILQSILAGSYQSEEYYEPRALNYWWGMSSGVIDLACSPNVPIRVKRLADYLKKEIQNGEITPFDGEFYSQNKTLRNTEHEKLLPEEIVKMHYLVDNVVGSIPIPFLEELS